MVYRAKRGHLGIGRVVVAAVALTLLAGGGYAAEGQQNAPSADGKVTVKVGLIGPKTGAAPQYWEVLRNGFQLGVDDFADTYKIDVQVVEADDKGSPETASREVQRLLNEEDVDVIFGPAQSGPSAQVAETIQRTGRPWMVPIAAADSIINPKASPNWAFRTNNNNAQAFEVTGQYLFRDGAKVGLIYSADGYGQSNLAEIEAYAKKKGHQLAASQAVQPAAPDMTAAVREMRSAGVDTLYIATTAGADAATVAKAMEQLSFAPTRLLAAPTVLQGFTDFTTASQRTNLQFVDSRDLTSSSVQDLVKAYEKKFGKKPPYDTALFSTYTAVRVYLQGAAAAGGAKDRSQVRDAIEKLPSVEINGVSWDNPFSANDHELYDADPTRWFLHAFDPQGKVITIGPMAK